MKWLCECDSSECSSSVELSEEIVEELRKTWHFVIVDGCPGKPAPGDVVVEKRDGYTLVREESK